MRAGLSSARDVITLWPMRTTLAPSPTQNVLHAMRIIRSIAVSSRALRAPCQRVGLHVLATIQGCRAFPSCQADRSVDGSPRTPRQDVNARTGRKGIGERA